MGYKKFIRSGNQLELYEYEKDLQIRRIKRKRQGLRGQSTGIRTFLGRSKESTDTLREILGGGRIQDERQTISSREGFVDGEDILSGGADTFSERERERTLGKRRDNAQRSGMAFRRVVCSNLSTDENPLLITLTHKFNQTDISESNRLFKLFIQRCRIKYGRTFRYIAVPEFQRRGAVHYHALFWGLPTELYYRERETRELANIWRNGFTDIILTDGNEKLSSYLAKYMIKNLKDARLWNRKVYFCSRNIKRPIVVSGFETFAFIEKDYALDTITPVIDKKYDTQKLGEGRYRLFDASSNLGKKE
jgi:hypothetical protein